MLPTNFGALADKTPELKPAVSRLQDWVKHHPSWKLLDPRIVAKDLRDIDPFLLSILFWELVEKGFYRRVYKVVTPSGSLADDDYEDPSKVPPRVPDRFNNYFETNDTDIVPILKPAEK